MRKDIIVAIAMSTYLMLVGCSNEEAAPQAGGSASATDIATESRAGQSVSPGASRSPPSETSKIQYIILDCIAKIEAGSEEATVSGQSPVASGTTCQDVLRLTGDGKIEVAFHAAGPVGQSEESQLRELGATVLFSSAGLTLPAGQPIGSGLIQARIPYDRLESAAAFAWVVAVTILEENPPD